jgi:hypothetical protein
MQSARYFYPILIKTKFSGEILINAPDIKFYEKSLHLESISYMSTDS